MEPHSFGNEARLIAASRESSRRAVDGPCDRACSKGPTNLLSWTGRSAEGAWIPAMEFASGRAIVHDLATGRVTTHLSAGTRGMHPGECARINPKESGARRSRGDETESSVDGRERVGLRHPSRSGRVGSRSDPAELLVARRRRGGSQNSSWASSERLRGSGFAQDTTARSSSAWRSAFQSAAPASTTVSGNWYSGWWSAGTRSPIPYPNITIGHTFPK